jgi:hypothetical protein
MGKIGNNITIDDKVKQKYQPAQPKNMPPLRGYISFYYNDKEITIPESRFFDKLEIRVVCDEMIIIEEDEIYIFETGEPKKVQLAFYKAKKRFEKSLANNFLYG